MSTDKSKLTYFDEGFKDIFKNPDTGENYTLGDAVTGARFAKGKVSDIKHDNQINNKSIAARSKDSICQFPVYISHSVRPTDAHVMSKAFERVYASFVQSALSMNKVIDVEEMNNMKFLKKIHTNLQESTEFEFTIDRKDQVIRNKYYEAIDDWDAIMQDSLHQVFKINERAELIFRVVPTTDETLIKESYFGSRDLFEGLDYLLEDSVNTEDDSKSDMTKTKTDADGNITGEETTSTRTKRATKSFSTTEPPKLLKESEIKKLNGMLPYTIEATFRVKDANKNLTDTSYIIGVKTVMHLINPNDLSDDIREILSGNEKKLQKVRYKTGEITAMNYFFNVAGLKKDATKGMNKDKRWLNSLKRLGEFKKLHGSLLKGPTQMIHDDIPIPNGTLVLTQSDILKIVDDTGIDLSKITHAKRLSKSIFLMSIAIVDATAGTMRVLMEGDSDWDVQSLASIESDIGKTDNSALAKELSKMVNR